MVAALKIIKKSIQNNLTPIPIDFIRILIDFEERSDDPNTLKLAATTTDFMEVTINCYNVDLQYG